MARKKKPEEAAEETKDATEASVEASGETAVAQGTEAEAETAAGTDDMPEAEAKPGIEEAEIVEESAAAENPETVEPQTGETPPVPVAPRPEPVIIRKAGFFPMLLGGVAAAAIGFGMARFVLPEGWPWPGGGNDAFEQQVGAQMKAQADALAALKAEVGRGPDLSQVTDQVGGLQAAIDTLATRIGDVSANLSATEARLAELEKRPATEAASPEAVAAYERELKALQDAMAAQRAEIQQVAAQAEQKEANAEITAQEAMTRAALSRIIIALDTGTGFADAAKGLADAGIDLPPELARVEKSGVKTMAQLSDSFPPAARAALTRARQDESGGLGGFLMTQLGARSLEPRAGSDPDAVLSRAEAAVKEGRLTDAVAELDALPEAARAEMSGWLEQAGTRAAAVAAVETLNAQVNGN